GGRGKEASASPGGMSDLCRAAGRPGGRGDEARSLVAGPGAPQSKDGLAMRLTALGNRLALLAALAGACASGSGCRRVPYIDQSRPIPREPDSAPGTSARVAQEDAEVKQAALLDES